MPLQDMCISQVAAMVMMATHHGCKDSYSTNAVKLQPAQITTQDDGSEWDDDDRVYIGTQHSTAQHNVDVIHYSMMQCGR